jgi:hypothetical protein
MTSKVAPEPSTKNVENSILKHLRRSDLKTICKLKRPAPVIPLIMDLTMKVVQPYFSNLQMKAKKKEIYSYCHKLSLTVDWSFTSTKSDFSTAVNSNSGKTFMKVIYDFQPQDLPQNVRKDLLYLLSQVEKDLFLDLAKKASTCMHVLALWVLSLLPMNIDELALFTKEIKVAATAASSSTDKAPTTFVPFADTKTGKVLKKGLIDRYVFFTTSLKESLYNQNNELQTKAEVLWHDFLTTIHQQLFLKERDRYKSTPFILSETVVALRKEHRSAYMSTLRSIATDPSYQVFVDRAHHLSEKYSINTVQQQAGNILQLYEQASSIKVTYCQYLTNLADKISKQSSKFNVYATIPEKLKGMYRVFEKTAFEKNSKEEKTSSSSVGGNILFNCSGVFDVVRGALQVKKSWYIYLKAVVILR